MDKVTPVRRECKRKASIRAEKFSHGAYAGRMDTKDSILNRAMGAQIAAEKAALRPKKSVRELIVETGLSESTINRILSEAPRDIHVTAIARFARVFGITPQELVRRAVERAEGFGGWWSDGPTLNPEAPVSPPVASIADQRQKKNPAEMTDDELEAIQKKAAINDEHMDQDESDLP